MVPAIYHSKDSLKDLKAFSASFMGHLEMATACLSQADDDLLAGAGILRRITEELLGSAQVVSGKLRSVACNTLEKLPTLLGAAEGSAEFEACFAEVRDDTAMAYREVKKIRLDYIDLLEQVQYFGRCVQVTTDALVITSMPEPMDDEHGLESQSGRSLTLPPAHEESQQCLELTLTQLDSMRRILKDCSDFWLMLHQAELQLRKLSSEAHALCEGQRGYSGRGALQSFCQRLRSFCGEYCGSQS